MTENTPAAAGARPEQSATEVHPIEAVTEREGKRPAAEVLLENAETKIVAFRFATGQSLSEHAARHPVVVQVLQGRARFGLPDRQIELTPGTLLHLTPLLRHEVEALEPTTLVVTMLLPHERE